MRVAVLLGLLPLIAATAAWPCSREQLFAGPFEPTQALEQVPRNARIWLGGGFNATGSVRIGTETHPMQGEGGVQFARPALEPGEVVYTLFTDEIPDAELDPVAINVVDEVDESPPVFVEAAPRVEVERFEIPGNSCQPGSPGRFVRVMPSRADDNFGVAGYRLVRRLDGEVQRVDASVGANPAVLQLFLPDDLPEGDLELVAFDLAGLNSAPRAIDISSAAPESAPEGGCGAAGQSATPLVALVLALFARRRRRR